MRASRAQKGQQLTGGEIADTPASKEKEAQPYIGQFLGADIDGVAGLLGAPRDRVLVLMLRVAEIAREGTCAPKVLSAPLGCWVVPCSGDPPCACSMPPSKTLPVCLPLPSANCLLSRNELLAWGPYFRATCGLPGVQKIFCVDASPSGAGLAAADFTEQAVQELWQRSEQRGYCAKLEAGLRAHDGVDILGPRVRFLDLAGDGVFRELLGLVLRRVVREWHGGAVVLRVSRLALCRAHFCGQSCALQVSTLWTLSPPFTTALRVGWLSCSVWSFVL